MGTKEEGQVIGLVAKLLFNWATEGRAISDLQRANFSRGIDMAVKKLWEHYGDNLKTIANDHIDSWVQARYGVQNFQFPNYDFDEMAKQMAQGTWKPLELKQTDIDGIAKQMAQGIWNSHN